MEVSIGGDRLGSGGKGKVVLNNFERSTHDLGYLWKTTMSPGTLVPFLSELALPGDTFDIDLDFDIMTLPTYGPLFGKFKVQLDVFQIPIRLYNSYLHMNKLGIGLEMDKVKFPQYQIGANNVQSNKIIDAQQINPSSIFAYLGVRGCGHGDVNNTGSLTRQFNAIQYLGYWDIYKQYYANKQEERGYVIHNPAVTTAVVLSKCELATYNKITTVPLDAVTQVSYKIVKDSVMFYTVDKPDSASSVNFYVSMGIDKTALTAVRAVDIFLNYGKGSKGFMFYNPRQEWIGQTRWFADAEYDNTNANRAGEPKVTEFPLENIDTMRENILKYFQETPYVIGSTSISPYGLPFEYGTTAYPNKEFSYLFNQEGLALKTYQSDIFNNWISTEWIDGPGGISEVTAIDTSGGSFTIDELNLANKVYNMLNRIAITGGSYNDWLKAVYSHEAYSDTENPFYLGGMQGMLYFQEIVSTAGVAGEPLASLAGKGVVGGNKKGGRIVAKIDKPSFLMGIISLTPIIDYSQGNRWENNLKHMDELHKPSLDQIGYQDLLTDQMTWWDTEIESGTSAVIFKSAGKQPAWVNYMTNVNRVYGNFALPDNSMFMTLNRRYTPTYDVNNIASVKDITTYIDPSKFNYIFADASLDAMNFWVQVSCDITSRRKMSSKIMPNL